MITVEQSRAARALLNWNQEYLAKKASLIPATIRNFELRAKHVSDRIPKAVCEALEKAGVEFIDADRTGGVGVRMKRRRR
jgi:transcriptional regulator with XRE-family HTH domain